MDRISIVGTSGSGKTTLAKEISERLSIPRLELDSVFHLPNWEQLPTEQFRRVVEKFTKQDRWVVDGNYTRTRDITWGKADTVVFLDLARWRVMSQLLFRTVARGITKKELWNGNTENLRNLLKADKEENILIWSWKTYPTNRTRYLASMAHPENAHLKFVHLTSRAEVTKFTQSLLPQP